MLCSSNQIGGLRGIYLADMGYGAFGLFGTSTW